MSKKIIILILIGIIFTTIPLTLFLMQRKQETRSRANASTSLSFTPNSTISAPIQKNIGDTVSVDIMVDPGSNLVSFVKFQIKYDPTKLSLANTNAFVPNILAFPNTIDGPVTSSDTISASVSIGADPTKVIQTTTRLGTLNFKAIGITGSTPTQITYTAISQTLSAGENEQASENTLSTTTPAYIRIIDNTPPTPTITPTPLPKTATIITSPSSSNVIVGTPFTVNIAINGGGQAFNAAEATISVSPNLSITNLTNPSSNACNFIYIQAPTTSNPNFVGAILGSSSLACTVYTLTLNPISAGTGTITISNGSVKAFSTHEEILSSITNGSYLIAAPTPTPLPSSTPTPIPTNTPTPNPTPATTFLDLTIYQHGIWNSGDNTNPTGTDLSNKNPVHTTINADLELFDTDNQLVGEGHGPLTYKSDVGNFQGSIGIYPNTFPSEKYYLKVKTTTHLKRLVPGILTVTAGQKNTVPAATMVTGDANNDNKLDILDYNLLLGCYSDLAAAVACDADKKVATDFNDDGFVNQVDYNLLLREIATQSGE